MAIEVGLAGQLVKYGLHRTALWILSGGVRGHVDGCSAAEGQPDGDDWVDDCDLQRKIYWDLQELMVLIGIMG